MTRDVATPASTAVVGLAALGALTLGVGDVISAPEDWSWPALEEWYRTSGGAVAVLVMLRVAASAAAAWLAAVAVLQLVARSVGLASLSRWADRCSPVFLRTMGSVTAGLALSAGMAPSALAGPPSPSEPPGTAVMVPLEVADPTSTTTTTTTTTTVPTRAPAPPPVTAPSAPAVAPTPPPLADGEVVVAPGDSFWTIAEDEAGPRAVDAYWRALIEANRERLVDPSNPDLLLPGQVLQLP